MVSLVAPNTLRITESASRWDSLLATVPASTAMPAIKVTKAVSFTAPPSRPITRCAVATASLTDTAETLENCFVTARSTSSAASSVLVWVVAIQLCGASSSTPGFRTKTKLIWKLCQSTSRKLYMRAVTSRPRTLILIVSPIVRPKSSAASFDIETSGGPL